MKLLITPLLAISVIYSCLAQQSSVSIHEEQSTFFSQYGNLSEQQFDSLQKTNVKSSAKGGPASGGKISCPLQYSVYGWYPYWMGTVYNNFDFSLLSTFCYFSYELNPSTGNYSSIHSWKTTSSVTLAQAAGSRVDLCVTNFGSTNNTTFLTSATAQQTFIDSIIALLQYRNANGVNIDFEGVPGAQRNNLTAFMIDLSNQLKAAINGASVSIALPSVDWSNAYDVAAMNNYVDQFIIMGYGYYYSGSSTAGPTALFYSDGSPWTSYNVVRSVNYFLGEGVTPSKLLLGLPYYGYEWQTTDNSVPGSVVSAVSSRTYTYERNNYRGVYPLYFDQQSFNPYYDFNSGGNWYQCWVDNEYSLGKKYDMVKQKGIGGIGIWALGYDDGYPDLWNLLRDKFTTCSVVPCTDTIYDTGGPNCNHYNDEDYTFTIAPNNASSVTINFTSFQLEAGYDSLWIYDGPNASSLLIGGYSGTTSPGFISSTGNALTLHFYSDGATIYSGWSAITGCQIDTVAPTTTVTVTGIWQTDDFTAQFTDADGGGSGLAHLFYQPLEYNGTEWRANDANGFYNDNFDNTLYPDWVNYSGTWSINSGYLNQTDEANSNTNLYVPLNQTAGEIYLYHWQMNIGGTGTNRRAGLHFYCDSAAQPNRGNSYFVYYRPDQDKCQIYKVVNDTWTLETDDVAIVDPNIWYDCKIIFNPLTGQFKVYMNDVLVSSWTDTSPFTYGNYISPRTGNADVLFNDLKVYRARSGNSITVSVGANPSEDIRYQNPNPSTPSGRIKSIVKDSADNWSAPAGYDVNIDWTPPADVAVNDGLSGDVDTVYVNNELSANWTSSIDTNSDVTRYLYTIGSSPGDSNIVQWKNNALNTSVTETGLVLNYNAWYYFSVKAENGAGLLSNIISSDGVYIANLPCAVNAAFAQSTDTLNLALNDSVVFTDQSTGGVTSWQWDFGNGTYSSVMNPIAYYDSIGTYTVSLITDNGLCSDTAWGEVVVVLITGEQYMDDSIRFTIYPNPNDGFFIIEIKNPAVSAGQVAKCKMPYELIIVNIFGQEVLKSKILNFKTEINIDVLDDGLYFCKVLNKDKIIQVGKIVIE